MHLSFIIFVIAGGAWAARRPRLRSWHLAAVAWGAAVEFFAWPCPLTPLEQWLRARAGEAGYAGDFAGHYLVSLIYPGGLMRWQEVLLGAAVLVLNGIWYAPLWRGR